MIGIIMFFASLVMLLYGFPVAFTFAAVSLLFGVIAGIVEIGFDDGLIEGLTEGISEGLSMFDFMPYRIMSIMENTVLMAIPMFIFMGIIYKKQDLLKNF